MKIKLLESDPTIDQPAIALLISPQELAYIAGCVGMSHCTKTQTHIATKPDIYGTWRKEEYGIKEATSIFRNLKEVLLSINPKLGEK